MEKEKADLENQVKELTAKCEAIEKREKERRIADEKKHEEDISFLKKKNNQYKMELERKNAPSKG